MGRWHQVHWQNVTRMGAPAAMKRTAAQMRPPERSEGNLSETVLR